MTFFYLSPDGKKEGISIEKLPDRKKPVICVVNGNTRIPVGVINNDFYAQYLLTRLRSLFRHIYEEDELHE